jgi:hypothetical protein
MVMDVIVDIDSDRGKPGITPSQIEASTMDRIRSGLLQPPSRGGDEWHNLTLFEGSKQAAFCIDTRSGVQLNPHPFHVTQGPNDEDGSGRHGDRIFRDVDGKVD